MKKVHAHGFARASESGFAEIVEVEFPLEKAIQHYTRLMIAMKVRKAHPEILHVSTSEMGYEISGEDTF